MHEKAPQGIAGNGPAPPRDRTKRRRVYCVVPAPLAGGDEPLGSDGTVDGELGDGDGVVGLVVSGLLGIDVPAPVEVPLREPPLPIAPSSVAPLDGAPGVPKLGLVVGFAVPLGVFTPAPVVPVLVPTPEAPELVEPAPIPACATSCQPPNRESAAAVE